MKRTIYPAIIILALSLMIGCSESTVTDPKDIIFPDTSVSYQKHVEPFMRLTCAYQGCHSSNSLAAGLALDDWFSMINAMSGNFIIPGKPDNSVLNQMLEGKFPHVYENIWRPRINDDQIKGMRQWVVEGANLN